MIKHSGFGFYKNDSDILDWKQIDGGDPEIQNAELIQHPSWSVSVKERRSSRGRYRESFIVLIVEAIRPKHSKSTNLCATPWMCALAHSIARQAGLLCK
jgi:hypothetical protein